MGAAERRAAQAVDRRGRSRDWRGIDEPALSPNDTGHVYVIGFAGYVKIDWSTKVRARVIEIDVSESQKESQWRVTDGPSKGPRA